MHQRTDPRAELMAQVQSLKSQLDAAEGALQRLDATPVAGGSKRAVHGDVNEPGADPGVAIRAWRADVTRQTVILDSLPDLVWFKERESSQNAGNETPANGGLAEALAGKADRDLRFEDLFNLEEIQRIQDAFAMATGVASVITDLDGRPLTRLSNSCRLCLNIIRQTEKGLKNCMCSDAELGKLNPAGPTIQPCLSGGLWDGGTSICVGDRHIANWLIGQVLDDTQNEEKMLEYGREIGADAAEYRAALREVTRMPREKFDKICQALYLIARQLSLLALKNVQQARANDALAQADRRKDEFLAMLSHELRNPLAPIRNTLELLRLMGGDAPRQRKHHELIERQVSHMARMLDDLLDVSRITRGKIQLRKQRLDLRQAVSHVLESCRGAMQQRRHELSHDAPAEPLWVVADPTRLEQVISNLLNNAMKYSEPGSRIWVETGLALDSPLGAGVPGVTFRVRDAGIGIAPEMLPRIFDLFAQAEQTLDRSQGGLGIGLTLVRRLVELHGGRIVANSAGLGHGSEFTVWLPGDRESGSAKPGSGDHDGHLDF